MYTTATIKCYHYLYYYSFTSSSLLIRCQEDFNSFPIGEPEETTRMPSYYMDEDYPKIQQRLHE